MVIKAHHATRHLGYDKRLVRSLLFALCSFRNGDGEDDAMVRDVASYQWATNFARGSNPDVDADAIYGLRLLLVLSSGFSERFFSVYCGFPLPSKINTLLKIPIRSERMDTFQRVLSIP